MNEHELREQRETKLRERMGKSKEEEETHSRMEEQLETMLNTILTPEARTRLTNVRLVNSEKYLQVGQALVVMARQGKISAKVTDDQLRQLLLQLTPKKKDMTIKRV